MTQKGNTENSYSFIEKVWIAGGIVAFIVILLLLLKATFSVRLLILAGALVAIFFRGLSGLICRKTKWKEGVCLTISMVGTLVLLVAFSWLIGSKVQTQVTQLSETLPATIENAKAKLSESPTGKKLLKRYHLLKQLVRRKALQALYSNLLSACWVIYM